LNKWVSELNRQFSKEVQKDSENKRSASLAKKETQIQKPLDFSSLQSEWLSSATQTTTNADEDVEKEEGTLIH
jgi:hypothetical protein